MGLKPRRIEVEIGEVVLGGGGHYDLAEWQGEFTDQLRATLEGTQAWKSQTEPIRPVDLGPGSKRFIPGGEAAITCARSLTK